MVQVEAFDAEGRFLQFAGLQGQILTPQMESRPLALNQVGPGQYTGQFDASSSGSYIVNLQYQKIGADQGMRLANTIVTIPFAPEFRDLSDNAPLLEEVTQITGGRVLPYDPNQANLYDYAGLSFPETNLPLLRPLMLIWLALFLLDVAVRRVVLDVRAGWRRAKVWLVAKTRRGERTETLSRLQASRAKLREQWSARSANTVVSKHYDKAAQYEGTLLNEEVRPETQVAVEEPPAAKPQKKTSAAPASHIDQLLQAKRRKIQGDEK